MENNVSLNSTNKVLYIRSGPYVLNYNSYNLQEVGLGKAFCKAGYDFDIVYYSKENYDQEIETPKNKLRILWRKGFKVLRTGIYPSIINKKFLKNYDIVIVSEYSQINTVIASKIHPNVYLYNGLYYNLFKLPFIESIYDTLFCRIINSSVKKVFSKTEMAKDFLAKKNITNCIVTGVGLDTEKFDNENVIKPETQELLKKMKGHRNFLYLGSIIKRKNVELLIEAFSEFKKMNDTEDVQLVLVGKGDRSYTDYCKNLVPDNLKRNVIWCSFIENAQTKFIYQAATVFLLPSIQEIFGMVLLEAMYFSTPVITSHSAGAGTLIKNDANGIIVEEFDKNKWADAMHYILNDQQCIEQYSQAAHETIVTDFLWDSIAGKMLKIISNELE